MLQRAASNAYSWWWASHVRTTQSKWLEQNLQDMEEGVKYTLKIIDEDGETFAQRAEMYYRKRPEIVSFVEEAFRSYRALAERYDHLSRDLQRANRTIASAFPDQVPISFNDEEEEEEDDDDNGEGSVEKKQQKHMEIEEARASIPIAPEMPKKDLTSCSSVRLSRKGTLRTNTSSVNKAAAAVQTGSGLSKSEALEEIDRLQKGILALQTEREFVKSTYEQGYEKYCKIENEIDEMQKRVCELQDEFGNGVLIDDNEARTLMAGTTIKSCKESLAKLYEKQRQSEEVAEVAKGRIKEALDRFEGLKKEILDEQTNHKKLHIEKSESNSTDERKEQRVESSTGNAKKELDADLTVVQLADEIDELVERVVSLEAAASSRTALESSLRSETDELQLHIRSLEEEKETRVLGSEDMKKRISVLEEELWRIKSLCQRFEEQNKNLRTSFVEASCNADQLSGKLNRVKMDEDAEATASEGKADLGTEEGGVIVEAMQEEEVKKEKREDVKHEEDRTKIAVGSDRTSEPVQQEKTKEEDSSEAISINVDIEQEESCIDEDEDQHNWGQMLSDGLHDREYTMVLRNYREVKRKLKDVEKKNLDGFFELALQVRELKNDVKYRDTEIETLRHRLYSIGKGTRQMERNQSESQYLSHEAQRESISQLNGSSVSSFPSPGLQEHEDPKRLAAKAKEKEVKLKQVARTPHPVPAVQKRIREHINELSEENLEFWMRFSTSVHETQKFQTSVQDLKFELSKINEKRKQPGNAERQSHSSEARPLYRQLRQIRTELQLWLENNNILKNEVQARHSSLCNLQDEISQLTHARHIGSNIELSEYQAAEFHGEVLSMKQENSRVLNKIHTGLDHARMLKATVERILMTLEEDLGISVAKNSGLQAPQMRSSTGRPKIPLRSFLFGVKVRKQKQQGTSMFSCANSSLQRQCSYMAPVERP